jgi:electron transfer flavoprotein alpha subunit
MPHTYQVRDFVPKLATALQTTVITDAIGYKYEGEKLLFARQMFQGKFVADVSFAGSGPYFVTFQNGSFRGDKVEAGAAAAPVETVTVDVPDSVVRNKPQEVFKEAKQAVDLTQAEIIVSVGRGIKEITAGCRWTARSDRRDRRSLRSCIWRSGSRARSSILLA